MSADTTLLAALAALGNPAHRDFILEVYASQGQVLRAAENARHILPLSQYRILIHHGRDRYGLSRVLTRFFDDVTQRQRLFDSMGESAAALLGRVQDLIAEYSRAVSEGNFDDTPAIADQFHGACADFSDAVGSAIERLLAHIENNFAIASTLAAKQRQNEYYLKQANQLRITISSLDRMNLIEQPGEYRDLKAPYEALILERCNEWNIAIIRVIHLLKQHLFRLRAIEPDVRRLRRLAGFLRQNPVYELPDIDGLSALPEWLRRDPGIRATAHTDLADNSTLSELETLARSLPARREVTPVVRLPGAVTRRAGSTPEEMIVVPAYRQLLQRFGEAVVAAPHELSAVAWKAQFGGELDVPDDVWLLLVLHAEGLQTEPFPSLRFEPVGRRGAASISRNLYLLDIVVDGPTSYNGLAPLRSVR